MQAIPNFANIHACIFFIPLLTSQFILICFFKRAVAYLQAVYHCFRLITNNEGETRLIKFYPSIRYVLRGIIHRKK